MGFNSSAAPPVNTGPFSPASRFPASQASAAGFFLRQTRNPMDLVAASGASHFVNGLGQTVSGGLLQQWNDRLGNHPALIAPPGAEPQSQAGGLQFLSGTFLEGSAVYNYGNCFTVLMVVGAPAGSSNLWGYQLATDADDLLRYYYAGFNQQIEWPADAGGILRTSALGSYRADTRDIVGFTLRRDTDTTNMVVYFHRNGRTLSSSQQSNYSAIVAPLVNKLTVIGRRRSAGGNNFFSTGSLFELLIIPWALRPDLDAVDAYQRYYLSTPPYQTLIS